LAASAARADEPHHFEVEPGQVLVSVVLGSATSQLSAFSTGLTGTLREENGELSASLSVPLKSFTSGSSARDAKVRAALGEADAPELTFAGSAAPAGSNGATRFVGTLTFHGVAQKIEFPVTVTRIGEMTYLHASFPLLLSKFGVSLPGSGDVLRIELDTGLRPATHSVASRG